MKTTRKYLSAALIGGIALGMAQSVSAIEIGGIELGQAGFSFEFADIYEEARGGGVIDEVGDELYGYGEVSSIRDNTGLIVWNRGDNGRELTFEFSGFMASFVSADHIDFTGGEVHFFSDTAQDFNPTNSTGTGNGDAWLDLAAVSQDFGGVHPDATLHSTGTLLGATTLSGTGVGMFEVSAGAGAANSEFNTDHFAYTSSTGGGNADFDFNSSFTNTGSILFDLEFNGTANLRGFRQVPEPATLALLGIGMLGAGASRYRSRRK